MLNNKDIIKIIVVTSSAFLNETFKKILTSGICTVEYYQDGLKCIKCAAENPPALIFIDMSLSGFFSLDVLKVLKALNLNKRIPIVAMILDAQQNLLPAIIDLGVSTILYKPFTRTDLLDIVNNLLGEKIKSKTEKMPVMEAVKINSSLQKTSQGLKTEKLVKLKTLSEFLSTVHEKEKDIQKALNNKNHSEVIRYCNELNNIGAILGYPRLSLLCTFVEKKLINHSEEECWEEVQKYINEVFVIFEQIQSDNSHRGHSVSSNEQNN